MTSLAAAGMLRLLSTGRCLLGIASQSRPLTILLIYQYDFTGKLQLIFQPKRGAVVLRPNWPDVLAGIQLEAEEATVFIFPNSH